MARESKQDLRKRAVKIVGALAREYPDAQCSLQFSEPFQLFVATVLSAQCTDARVNLVTRDLFKKYRSPADFARSPAGELEADIRSTGFFNSKAKSLRNAAAAIVERFGGRLPDREEDLLTLAGVGRKTANVILGNAFGKPAGMVVDTHVGRIARRLGLTRQHDPVKVENDMNELVPAEERALLAHRLIEHGRAVCTARKALCGQCVVAELCPKIGVAPERVARKISKKDTSRSRRGRSSVG